MVCNALAKINEMIAFDKQNQIRFINVDEMKNVVINGDVFANILPKSR